jgi:hypothetical protein
MENATMTVHDFKKGQRVELHPGTDRWMRGDRFGTVTSLFPKRNKVYVYLEKSGKTLGFFPGDILPSSWRTAS